ARYMSLQTQLQNGADALALAGAAELDRLPDAEDRAVRAIRGLLANSSLLGAGADRNVQVASIQFFSQIPARDDAPLAEALVAPLPTHTPFRRGTGEGGAPRPPPPRRGVGAEEWGQHRARGGGRS